MLYEVITHPEQLAAVAAADVGTDFEPRSDEGLKAGGVDLDVITSYSIHYTKLYD